LVRDFYFKHHQETNPALFFFLDLQLQIWPLFVDTARLILQSFMKFDLKELGDSSGSSEPRSRAIQNCKSLAITAKDIENLVLKSLKPYRVFGDLGTVRLTNSATKNLRKLIHSAMFITLNTMVSKKRFLLIKPCSGDLFDPESMESMGGEDSAERRQVLFTVQYGLQQLDKCGKISELVCKAKVVV
jgi:hypothetical protein